MYEGISTVPSHWCGSVFTGWRSHNGANFVNSGPAPSGRALTHETSIIWIQKRCSVCLNNSWHLCLLDQVSYVSMSQRSVCRNVLYVLILLDICVFWLCVLCLNVSMSYMYLKDSPEGAEKIFSNFGVRKLTVMVFCTIIYCSIARLFCWYVNCIVMG